MVVTYGGASKSDAARLHLFFADDLILFSDATCGQTRVLKTCLDLFCDLSGQDVSNAKSVLYVSPNT